MRTIYLACILIVTLGAWTGSNAQVYQWTDENGETHFGDRVPEKYRQDAQSIKIRTTTIKTNKPATPSRTPVTNENQNTAKENTKLTKKKRYKPLDCKARWERYRRAQACREDCSADSFRFSGGGIGKKHSGCGCEQVKRPNCSE